MTYKIANAMKTGEYESKFGKMFKYTIQFEGESEAVELSQKPESPAPKVGDQLEGTIEDTQYGRKFRKERKEGGQVGGYKSNPETQKQIIRQNALTNAVAYCIAKSQADKKYELSGKHVIQVATYFAKYSFGSVTVVTENEKPEEPKDEPQDTPLPPEPEETDETHDTEDDINLEEIPF
jgi:hypothetical protein